MDVGSSVVPAPVKPPERPPERIVNPVFLKCMQFVGDSYWIDVFRCLSLGEPTHGVTMTRPGIVQIGDDEIQTNHPAELVWVKILDAFHRIGIYSTIENFHNRAAEELRAITKWSSIKSKNIKDRLLLDYARTRCKSKSKRSKILKFIHGNSEIKLKKVVLEGGVVTSVEFANYPTTASASGTGTASKSDGRTVASSIKGMCGRYVKDEVKIYTKYGLLDRVVVAS